MNKTRKINDVCNDINETLEDYERDGKYIDVESIYGLKNELCGLITASDNNNRKIDGSFAALACHLQDAMLGHNNPLDIDYPRINNIYISWDQFPIYVGLYQSICDVFPVLGEEYLRLDKFGSYGDLTKSRGAYKKSIRSNIN